MDHDVRVQDYLDDKLQSAADLEQLDTLLSSVEFQRSQLQSQLDDASRELDAARRSEADRAAHLAARIADFHALQRSIDDRLDHVSRSNAPDHVIGRLEPKMAQLRRLDLAHRYLVLLRDVDDLSRAARGHLPHDPRAALEPYARLKQLAADLRRLQRDADGAAVHLVAHVDALAARLWDDMKDVMRAELDALLSARGWPNVDPDAPVDDDWLRCFEKLVDLQVPEVLGSPEPVTLLAVDVMAAIFVKEFRYHFLSDKPTSSPQGIAAHCFPWFLALLERWEGFLRDNFGPVLAAKFAGTPAARRMAYLDPVCALISSMLPVMRDKLAATLAETSGDPAFLSSLLSQLMTLDDRLRADFAYDGGDPDGGWDGLASEVLATRFGPWLDAEKAFALERFQAIMTAPDARKIDYDFAGPGRTKPTFAAVRVADLLRSVTTQYERVRRFSHKLRFLIDIQVTILDEYHDSLRGSLEAYVTLTSAVGRAFGVTKEQLAALEGTGALETLCKVYGSADHIVNVLKEWSNEEFFVTLWAQLQARAKAAQDQTNLAGGMSYDHVRDKTSSAVGKDDGEGDSVLFDETIAAYSQRRKRAEEFLSEALVESHRKAFRAYLHRTQWSTVADDAAAGVDGAITPELDEPLRILKRDLAFLQRALGTAPFRRVWRAALEQLNASLWTDVLMAHRFTASGAAQLSRDVRAVAGLVERFLPDGSAALASMEEALRLLNLPVAVEEGPEEPQALSLKRATDRVFTDNAEAKQVLEELDIVTLTPANARQILQRRVENAE
ncbi:hypothetical protein VTJ83DRAFT_3199 [Remersonia thermophila]|uniref:RAD50-interacting protein 1 n=1 Tax=Remersonia thermophila TaxID=72144 RepID=A0ABR4DDD1_9PEZI